MSTDTFDITKLSRAMILRTPWIYGLLSAGIKDNGVFVKSLIENALKKMRKHFLALLTMNFQSYN